MTGLIMVLSMSFLESLVLLDYSVAKKVILCFMGTILRLIKAIYMKEEFMKKKITNLFSLN